MAPLPRLDAFYADEYLQEFGQCLTTFFAEEETCDATHSLSSRIQQRNHIKTLGLAQDEIDEFMRDEPDTPEPLNFD